MQMFSDAPTQIPIRVDPNGVQVMPEWSDNPNEDPDFWRLISDSSLDVSRDGRVRDTVTKEGVKPFLLGNEDNRRYHVVVGNDHRPVAELVLETFVGPRPSSGSVPRHKDNNLLNDTLPNLSWHKPKLSKVTPPPRKRVSRDLQPDATQMDTVTQATEWLKAHPEEAAMLRSAQISATGDILSDSGVVKRYYSSPEAAAFFDKTVQWLYWGMRHPPHGGRLFIQPKMVPQLVAKLDDDDQPVFHPVTGAPIMEAVIGLNGEPVMVQELDADGDPVMVDIPVERLGDPKTGKRRFDIDTIRKFAISAYHQANIKEPKLRAVLQRLVVAEGGGDWKSIPIPKRQEDTDGPE